MVKANVIWIFSPDGDKVLMCKRHKEPYLGLYNLLGGKINKGEDKLAAAYRELEEEAGIRRENLTRDLHHLMDSVYYDKPSWLLQVFAGRLAEWVDVYGDEKELVWIDVSENFFDMGRFAGEGNIGHIYEMIKQRAGLV